MAVVSQAKEDVHKILPDDSSTLILFTAQEGPWCTVKDIIQAYQSQLKRNSYVIVQLLTLIFI